MKGQRTVVLNNGAEVPKPLARLAAMQIQELARLHSDTLDAVVDFAHGSEPDFTPEQLKLLIKQSILEADGSFTAHWRDLIACSVEYETVPDVTADDYSIRVRLLVNPLRIGLKQLNRPHRKSSETKDTHKR